MVVVTGSVSMSLLMFLTIERLELSIGCSEIIEILSSWLGILTIVGWHEDTLKSNLFIEVILSFGHMGSPPESVILFRWLAITFTPPDISIKSISVSHLEEGLFSNLSLSWRFLINIVGRFVHWFSVIEPPVLFLVILNSLLLHNGGGFVGCWPSFSVISWDLNIITEICFDSDHSDGHQNFVTHVLYFFITKN